MSYFDNSDDNDSIMGGSSENSSDEDSVYHSKSIKKSKLAKFSKDDDDESIASGESNEASDDEFLGGDGEGEEEIPDSESEVEDIGEDEGEGEDDGEEEDEPQGTSSKQPAKKIRNVPVNIPYDEDSDEEVEEDYLKKFDSDMNRNYIAETHPECILHNYDEIQALTKVVRDKNGMIVDPLHKTLPFLTKYERARILGMRAKQINSGAIPFVKVPENVIDGHIVAMLELKQKRIPFVIRRPLPNGGSEYWNLKDLEDISY